MDGYEGFREFVLARGPALMGTAYLLTGERHLAEDLLQIVLSRLAARWQRIERDGNPEAYARTALYRESVSWWRVRRNREVAVAEIADATGTDDFTHASVRRLVLQRAMARLTPRQRAVLVLRFYEDLGEAETARLLGCSAGTVKSQTHHALRRLRSIAPELAELLAETDSARSGGAR
ncbi:SigE family RNA polymerase sigma factor [Acrocarpospora corrugata]|uniref:SigE family RNA polymerase sigma factor n=1 Tax=Acrocarpospora corrugata TaxID=35763 RepID=UPI0012D2EE1A|nr:SigE family RNA polymerase sigma factor [Acrocarpospora corrugata]